MDTHNLLIMAIPALVALAGGFLASLWSPSQPTRSLIQHFAAGVVLAALAVELLPEIEREHAPGLILISAFALGSLFMYGLKLWTIRLEHHAEAAGMTGGLNSGLLLATFIDVAMDGFIIGAGFAAGGNTGMILALGLSVSGALGGTVLCFSLIGNSLLSGASPALIGGVLAFSAAALLYLVTEELLMEAHAVEEKPVSTLVLFGGFLAFWSIQLLGQG